jgi:natural product biosynthesis luciferase-like monooxygenase protein/amino acid adenylation domain-containing protein/non-ribosomal peptide synthase protein (TIGR01720 family)
VGGEALPLALAEDALGHLRGGKLLNMYGPTETTIWSSTEEVQKVEGASVPIGRPISNNRFYVLDERLSLVPVGLPGELYIGGESLARGYWQRPELTAERFVADPFGTSPGGRMYRTGDLVRWRPDGTLEYLRRQDSQVKVRGFRIELGEVEAALGRATGVVEGVVVVKGLAEKRRLVAYVVGKGEKPRADELRAELGRLLPEYMVPGQVVRVDKLPLTPNGKVDRRALPEPEEALGRREYEAPATELEKRLASFWEEMLMVDRVGRHDNFFDLGGNSLLAMQVMARFDKVSGALSVRTLFESPVLWELARELEGASSPTSASTAVAPLTRVPRTGPLPLSYAQERFWFLQKLEPASSAYNLAGGIHLRGALDTAALERAFEALAHRHEVLRTSYVSVDGVPAQVVSAEVTQRLSRLALKDATAEQVQAWAAEESGRPFAMEGSALWRAHVLELSAREWVLIFVAHHSVFDGWSLTILIQELAKLYEAEVEGRAAGLAPLELQYADYSVWQRERLRGETLERELAYWTRTLSAAPAVLELPTDFSRPAVRDARGGSEAFTLPRELVARLEAFTKQEGATPFMAFVAAFGVLLGRYAVQEDVVVGTPVAGRTHPGLEALLGDFVNMLALRLQVEGAQSFQTLLGHVKERTLESFAYQETPFEKVVNALKPDRSLAYAPIYQVSIVLQNVPASRLEVSGLELFPYAVETQSVQDDLRLELLPEAGGVAGRFRYRADLFTGATVKRMAGHFVRLLEAALEAPSQPTGSLTLLSPEEKEQLLETWNATQKAYPRGETLHGLFEARVKKSPMATAVVFEGEALTYAALDAKANGIAQTLRSRGLEVDEKVAVVAERGLGMVVGLLGVLKAGGAYVPVDPTYPEERVRWMLEDSQARWMVTNGRVSATALDVVRAEDAQPAPGVTRRAEGGESLAYIIYTSGSTGRPKGTMISHRSVLNFLQGMDERLGSDVEGKTWLAVTSISFDISGLELWWALTRGMRVVVRREERRQIQWSRAQSRLSFSLFYFGSGGGSTGPERNLYRLLQEGAKVAEEGGFEALWTPERHFHEFGGPYPSPMVLGGALAAMTQSVEIRAGSVVLPLNDTARVAEEWALVDRLSNGRVSLAFASGWHANDFVLAPSNYEKRRELLMAGIDQVRRWWRGEEVDGRRLEQPPVRGELPVWVTAAGSPETFRQAGKRGARVLTHLLGQDFQELSQKIAVYRKAWAEAGHEGSSRVALMIHTFVGDDDARVKALVKEPFKGYLRGSLDLMKGLGKSLGYEDGQTLSESDLDVIVEHGFERYYDTAGLFGRPERCLPILEQARRTGVDELACLIDFGVDEDEVVQSLQPLRSLKALWDGQVAIAEQLVEEKVTHLQCTPSYLKLVTAQDGGWDAISKLERLLLGGEALPVSLVEQALGHLPAGRLLNMYGPTETTIWSSTETVQGVQGGSVPIGRPISNTTFRVLDERAGLVPQGVPGELFIGGEGLARGYWQRPDITAERFIPDSYARVPGARLYRTGDVVRWLSDGKVEYLGRKDNQVKVRGFRIELGEVEAVLSRQPDVSEAVVQVKGRDDAKRLVAYVVAKPQANLDTAALREALASQLPEYMVPGQYVLLQKLPLTPNGKVDRKALPEPEAVLARQEYEPPATPTEVLLATLWAEILMVDKVGRQDSFFELGGHSLMAMQVMVRLTRLGYTLALRRFFEAPTLSALAAQLEGAKASAQRPALVRVPRTEALPLSYGQERFWFLQRMEPRSAAYNNSWVFEVSGTLERSAFLRAFDSLANRHEVLRTTFALVDGHPVQRIAPEPVSRLTEEDFQDASAAQVQARVEQDFERPFSMEGELLWRAGLLTLSPTRSVLILVMHHSISDGWSIGVMMRDFAALYAAEKEGRAPALAPLEIQYADFAVWQREWLRGEVLEHELKYWTGALAGAPVVLELPTDHPRPLVRDARGETEFFQIDAGLAGRVEAYARQEGASEFMVYLAAFNVLLSRYAWQEDVVVGTPVAGRVHQSVEGLVGDFINMLALRVQVEGGLTFQDLLGQVKRRTLDAFEHQNAPFEKVVDAVKPERSLSHAPVFQVIFVFQNNPAPRVEAAGLTFGRYPIEPRSVQADLTLHLNPTGSGLTGSIVYRTDLFLARTARAMSRQLGVLLEDALSHSSRSIRELTLLTDQERQQVLVEWNQTRTSFPETSSLGALFEAQVRASPRAIAATFEGTSLTYAELDARANRLARRLRSAGVGPESRVGMALGRSLEAVVSILAILKAGGAYVPLDPSYPDQRLAWMVEDTQVEVLITLSSERELGLPAQVQRIVLDAEAPSLEQLSGEPLPSVGVLAQNLAYVMFTSGSTGRPKGVGVTHQNVVRLVRGQRFLPFDARSVFLLHSALAFDASTLELWGPLLNGGRIAVAPRGLMTPAELGQFMEREQVTCAWMTAGFFNPFVEAWPEQLRSLRYLLAGGDVVSGKHVRGALERLGPDGVFINGYGPTECTTFSTTHSVTSADDLGDGVPIGRPLANAQTYVLDDWGNPTPAGVPGELFIGGMGLARGYLGRPELTAEKFVPNPFGAPGSRLYRSGDVVRARPDGVLQFMRRVDGQVKLRGFRIELKEVEAALNRQANVGEGIVVLKGELQDKRLIAYVVATGGVELDAATLRAGLGTELPDYMLPGQYVFLDKLPLTPTGKVDRKALPEPAELADRQEYVAPVTEAEKTLAAIWQEVLRTTTVGVTENFFELGGDSILAIQVVSRASAKGLKLTPRQLFEAPTVRALAEVVEPVKATSAEQGAVTGEAPLTPIQRWYLEGQTEALGHFNQALLFEVGPVSQDALESAVAALSAHHDALRARYSPSGDGGWRQTFSATSAPALEIVDFAGVENAKEAVEKKAQQLQESFDLTTGPLWRVCWMKLGEGIGRLWVGAHHLVVDGVSWRVLLEDLDTAYRQAVDGLTPRLPAKTTSFKAWAEGLALRAKAAEAERDLEVWERVGSAQTAALPVEGEGENRASESLEEVAWLDEETTQKLLKEAGRAYRTQVDDLLLTALVESLTPWRGSDELLVALEGHGREELVEGADVSRTVGWFTSVYPVELKTGDGGWGEKLKRVKEQLREVPGKGVGYGLLKYLGSPEARARLARGTAPKIAFNYLGQLDNALDGSRLLKNVAPEAVGTSQSPRHLKDTLLTLDCAVVGGRLQMRWTYSSKIHSQQTLQRLASGWTEALKALVAHCLTPGVRGRTPSDFPLVRLTPQALDALLADRRVEDLYPLTGLQEGMLFHALAVDEGSPLYMTQLSARMVGQVEPDRMKDVLRTLTSRHSPLRTAFAWQGLPRSVQWVEESVSLPWEEEDLRGVAPSEQESLLAGRHVSERTRGFDLGHAPVWRVRLVRLSEQEYELIWTIHHLLLDGWSTATLLREFFLLYANPRLELPGVRPFKDHVEWLERRGTEGPRSYWRNALSGMTAPTPLPATSGAKAKGTKGYWRFSLGGALSREVEAYARGRRVTFGTLLQAAYGLLLSRYANGSEAVFGLTVSGRRVELKGVEQMVGMLINTVPVRVRVPDLMTVEDWIGELQRSQIERQENDNTPLVDIQRWSEVPKGTPLFETFLVIENYPVDEALMQAARSEGGLSVKSVSVAEQDNYPLTVVGLPGSELAIGISYDTGLFDEGTAQRLVRQPGPFCSRWSGSPRAWSRPCR